MEVELRSVTHLHTTLSGFRVQGSGFRVYWGSRVEVGDGPSHKAFRVEELGGRERAGLRAVVQLHTQSSGFGVKGAGFWIQNLEFVGFLDLAFRLNSMKRFQLFPLSSAAIEVYNCLGIST